MGAASYRLKALADALYSTGAEVEIMTSRPPKGSDPVSHPYRVRRWPVLRDPGGNVRGYVQYLSFDIPLFFRLLFSRKADVVVVEPPPTTGLMVAVATALKLTPFVYFSADVSSSAAKGIGVSGPILKVLTVLERLVLRQAKSIMAVSRGVEIEVSALIGGNDSIYNVGTGVDTTIFRLAGPNMEAEGKYFVYAGTMSEIQGAGVFIDAFLSVAEDHPDVRLIIFGQGTELEILRQRAAPAGSQIVFNPPASGEIVATWLRSSVANLASVRPNKGYDFAFATKALAGLSAGAPAIYSGVGPLKDLIAANNLGKACDWDASEVAAAMREALVQPVDQGQRLQISDWVEENYSLTAVGRTAAGVVLAATGPAHCPG
ncbi:glycosyltransferase [Specibacter sp. NPDC078709]|uniref:glycosyltransferase n=1 Tax=Specibacter sp. NPDC078709 TaxID=3154364 RepID=UPI00342526F3